VERFPYQNGLVVWYVDYRYGDNNTSQHPGGGLALPVDARPGAIANAQGTITNRRGAFDATLRS
jgi:immune inhibitor A